MPSGEYPGQSSPQPPPNQAPICASRLTARCRASAQPIGCIACPGSRPPRATPLRRSRRPVVLVDMAVDALERHRERQGLEREQAGELWQDPSLVFTNTVGGHVWGRESGEAHFYPLLAKAGIRRERFHDLRHSTATLLFACGIHPKVVSEILGHSAIHITLDLYTHVNEGMQRHALEALEELIGGQLGRQEPESGADEDAASRREAEPAASGGGRESNPPDRPGRSLRF